MRVLFIASEAAPWSKTGGLGDVCGALPAALAARGHQVALVTPAYRGALPGGAQREPARHTLHFPFGDVSYLLHTLEAAPRLTCAFIDAPEFFDRPGVYGEHGGGYGDNARRYAFFSMAALSAAQSLAFAPEVVHLNDWQTALAALALRQGFGATGLARARTVFTIHNLSHQGVFPKTELDALGLPWELFRPDAVEFFDQLCFLKAALVYADHLIAVSPTYAREILTPEGGSNLDGLLRARQGALSGILNGIDAEVWNPRTDALLPARYSSADFTGKERCAHALLERFALTLPPSVREYKRPPIFGVVGRMTGQKGVDLLQAAAPGLLARGARLVVVGTGEPRWEDGWRQLAALWPGRLGVRVGFDEPLAHLVEAGSDFFLMPSRFEPCGLNQMYSQAYGTVPVVRGVGGLADTVTDLGQPGATGIVFHGDDFVDALGRALALYDDTPALHRVRTAGMARDFSWNSSAQAYEAVYQRLLASPRTPAGP